MYSKDENKLFTLKLDEETDELVITDQTKLPGERVILRLKEAREIYDAIKMLKVRGAPAIGVAAALGLYVCAVRFEDDTKEGFLYSLRKTKEMLASSRPTARDLFYALDEVQNAAVGDTREEILSSIKKRALSLRDECINSSRLIGEYGSKLLTDGCTVLTHCNAGSLAAVEYGTALAPIYRAKEKGKNIKVFADETRPLLQGARLTCCELYENGIDVTLCCDGMSARLMQEGKIDAVIVGCDRAAKNFDFANKIGTLPLAISAKYYSVPFYVACPSSTFDKSCPSGNEIVVEQRDEYEVTDLNFQKRIAPVGIKVFNPAFDVIPHSLVTAFITEKGVIEIEQ